MSFAQLLSFPRIRSRTGWIGIDIGSHSVKLAQLESVDGNLRIAESIRISVPSDALLTANSLRKGWLTRLLRDQLGQQHGFVGRNVACGVSMSLTDFQSMTIPPGSPEEQREMIDAELAENRTSHSGPIEFDFWACDPKSSISAATESVVNVLSISNEVATELAESIQRTGLHCQVLDGGPFTLARSMTLMADRDVVSAPVAILDWGHHNAHFAIVSEGQPVFSRLLNDCGVGELVNSVQRGSGLSTDDCLQLLATCGVSDPNWDLSQRTDLHELVEEFTGAQIEQLLIELDKTLSYLRTQRSDLIPSEMWLVGGGATIKHITERLAFETGLSVMPWQMTNNQDFIADAAPVQLFAHAAALSKLRWAS